MNIDGFRELWQRTMASASVEIRRTYNNGNVKIEPFLNYCKNNLVNGLWFSLTFVNDYNEWISNNVPISEHVRVKKTMLDIRIQPKSVTASYIGFAVTLVSLITALVAFLIPKLIPGSNNVIGFVALAVMVVSFVFAIWYYRQNKGTATRDIIMEELERVGKNVEDMLLNISTDK